MIREWHRLPMGIFPQVLLQACSPLFSAQDKKKFRQSHQAMGEQLSYSHFKCRDHNPCAAFNFIPNKSVSKGTKIFKNLTDFSVYPKDLIGIKAALKLWSQNLNSKYLTHFLTELHEFLFVSSTG